MLPCLLGFVLGWAIWERWLAQTATIFVWALFLLPFAATASLGGEKIGNRSYWLGLAGLFALSLLLTELGIRSRDAFQRYVRRRFPSRFAPPS